MNATQSSPLDQVASRPQPAPRRLMLYGVHGIGKSTFAAQGDAPIFIQIEDGLGDIDCHRFPLATSFDDVMKSLVALYSEKHEYRTVVIDSLDWLERLIWQAVCESEGVTNIEKIGYAKGYVFALEWWRKTLDGLSALRRDKGMTTILIAHSKIERFENPETDSYDRFAPRLHRHASSLVQEWCDEVLFACYKVFTKTTDEGFNRKRVQGISTGERVLRTSEQPSHVAKNRLNLPGEIAFDWHAYASFFGPHGGSSISYSRRKHNG